ncbi:MAG: hypothetical protein FJ014_15085 [Chloroflexi bacterium]|nr:hypothetical protein [Chloroflexota bacterium]
MDNALDNKVLSKDPIFKIIAKMFHRPWKAFVAAAIIHGVIYFTANVLVGHVYGAMYLPWNSEPDNFLLGMLIWLVVVPTGWAYSVWLPQHVLSAAQSLEAEGLIFLKRRQEAVKHNEGSSEPTNLGFSSRLGDVLGRSRWPLMGLILAMTVIFWFVVFAVPEDQRIYATRISWYSEWRSYLLNVLMNGFNAWVYCTLLFKLAGILKELSNAFSGKQFEIVVHSSHPDQAGGYSRFGAVGIRIGLLVVMIGLLISAHGLRPLAVGKPPRFDLTMCILYLGYIILAPIGLLMPIWPIHKAMQRYRESLLKEISERFCEVRVASLDELDRNEVPSRKIEDMKNLHEMYQLILETTPVWPISVAGFRGFSIMAFLPLLSPLLSEIVLPLAKNLAS